MTDINQWMISNKFAKNEFNAAHIFAGLDLAHEPRFWKRVYRVILYRDWRNSNVYNTTAECYAKAIAGERVAKLPLDSGGER